MLSLFRCVCTGLINVRYCHSSIGTIAKMKDTLGKMHFHASAFDNIQAHEVYGKRMEGKQGKWSSGRHFFAKGTVPNHWTRHGDGRHMADKGHPRNHEGRRPCSTG